MSAYEEIRNLLGTYAELMDDGDFVGLGQLFAHAELVDDKGRRIARGAEEITALWTAMVRTYDGSPRTRHVVSGPVIEVDGESATCRSGYVAFQLQPDGPFVPVAGGRYRDAFAVVDGRWRFTRRQFFLDQEGDLSQHLVDL